jgi:hypothetical protein
MLASKVDSGFVRKMSENEVSKPMAKRELILAPQFMAIAGTVYIERVKRRTRVRK